MNEEQRHELIRQAVDGDADALQRLIVEYHTPLCNVVERQISVPLRRLISAEDILQQAYTEAFQVVSRYAFDSPARFYRWLEEIALSRLKTAARDLQRQKRDVRRNLTRAHRERRSSADLVAKVASPQSTPSRHLAKQEASAAALSSLARLADDQRKVIQMRILENRPVSEIAEEMKRTKGAIHMLLKRGLDNLAGLMGSITKYMSHH